MRLLSSSILPRSNAGVESIDGELENEAPGPTSAEGGDRPHGCDQPPFLRTRKMYLSRLPGQGQLAGLSRTEDQVSESEMLPLRVQPDASTRFQMLSRLMSALLPFG